MISSTASQDLSMDEFFKMGESFHDDENYEQAYKYFMPAATKGHWNAILRIAAYYKNGQYVKKDLNEATKWYQKAISQAKANPENANSQYVLATCYISGNAVEQNMQLGLSHLEKAANLGHEDAKGMLEYLEHQRRG